MNTTTSFRIMKMSPQLRVSDLERSIEFYTNKLNFAVNFRYDDFYSGISKDGFSIHLKSSDLPIDRSKSNEELEILFSVEDIEQLYHEFLEKSVEIAQALREMPYGKEFYIADPDGNIIAFVEA
jgi:predicted enzyme related to lactoylglutathione lyase